MYFLKELLEVYMIRVLVDCMVNFGGGFYIGRIFVVGGDLLWELYLMLFL